MPHQNNKTVSEDEVTIVFQGPEVWSGANNLTFLAVSSARKMFPNAPIVFSTWQGVDNAVYAPLDVLVVNSIDPGSIHRDEPNGILLNLQRQLDSSSIGLNTVETKYSVKLRSDLAFRRRNLLELLSGNRISLRRDPEYCFLKNRVVVLDVTSIDPRLKEELPFHPCDWLYAGLTEDLRCLFPVGIMVDENEIATYYKSNPKPINNPFPTSSARYHPESFIFYNAMKKFTDIEFSHLSDTANNNIELSERLIFNNLYIVSMKKIGVKSLKHKIPLKNYVRTYSEHSWIKLGNSSFSRNISFDLRMKSARTLDWFYFLRLNIRNVLKSILGRL
jgi:hypothetical protein